MLRHDAYQQLTAEGYLASRAGGCTQVAAGPGGLIFGHATVSERAIAEGAAGLAQVIGEL